MIPTAVANFLAALGYEAEQIAFALIDQGMTGADALVLADSAVERQRPHLERAAQRDRERYADALRAEHQL